MRDLACGDLRIYLDVEVRRVACRRCGTVKQEHPAVAAGAGGSGHRVSRKGAKAGPRRPKPAAAQDADAMAVSVLPMELQVGDRFTDHDFEWEVVIRPEVLHGAKSLRARIQRPGLPESEREMTWPAHVRIEIRRGQS